MYRIYVFYKDKNWCDTLNISKDGAEIRYIDMSQYSGFCGSRINEAYAQSSVGETYLREVIGPMVTLSPGIFKIWHNERWFDFKELFPPIKNRVKEAEEWLVTL